MERHRFAVGLRLVNWGVIACSVTAAVGCYLSYRQDRARLRQIAHDVTIGVASPSKQVLALLHWVHLNKGSARNEQYFGWRHLGPTPAQALDGGGDCADKSRLLGALLREIDIPSTLAMCFDPQTGQPMHTLVEVRLSADSYMAIDPAYDLHFPRPHSQGYYDLLDLRRDPDILSRRIDALCAQTPSFTAADRYYLHASVAYYTASTINWSKNGITRFLRSCLNMIHGDEVYRIPRPFLLEEPKLCVAAVSLIPGGLSLFALVWMAWLGRLRRRLKTDGLSDRQHIVPMSFIAASRANKHGLRMLE